jgi:hypothetical protein
MKKTIADYPEILLQWHPTKNGDLTPNMITAGCHKKIWWKCPVAMDHEWLATANHRTHGRGCPCCRGRKVVASNCLETTHPEIAKQWHSTKNGNLTPNMVTAGSHKKVWWVCDTRDHEWQTSVLNRTNISHSNKGNCPYCCNKRVDILNCLETTHPCIAAQWHPTKNGELTPKKVVAGSGKKIWWKCNNGHQWIVSPNQRTSSKSNCPICNESKGEAAIANELLKIEILFKRQKRFNTCKYKKSLPFDFIIKTNNGLKIIEYHGKQHYEPSAFGSKKISPEEMFAEIKKHDAIKSNWCMKQNIPLLVIPYWDFNRIQTILKQFIF